MTIIDTKRAAPTRSSEASRIKCNACRDLRQLIRCVVSRTIPTTARPSSFQPKLSHRYEVAVATTARCMQTGEKAGSFRGVRSNHSDPKFCPPCGFPHAFTSVFKPPTSSTMRFTARLAVSVVAAAHATSAQSVTSALGSLSTGCQAAATGLLTSSFGTCIDVVSPSFFKCASRAVRLSANSSNLRRPVLGLPDDEILPTARPRSSALGYRIHHLPLCVRFVDERGEGTEPGR